MAKGTEHKVSPYIICDFETGGLKMSECALTEIAMIAIKGDTLEEIARYETVIQPHQVLNKKGEWVDAVYEFKAGQLTGLTKEYCQAHGKDIETVTQEMDEFFKTANVFKSRTGYKPVIVAHNAQYEVKCFQNMSAGRMDLSKNLHGDIDFHGNFAPHYIDTLDLAKLLWAHNPRQTAYKLSDVLGRAGIPIYDAHRAMNDVRPSTEFFQWVIKLLRAADRSNVLSKSDSTVNEDGQIVNETGRTFKFQFSQ